MIKMKAILITNSILLGILAVCFGLSGCTQAGILQPFDADAATKALDAALLSSVSDENSEKPRNAVLRVDIPDYDFSYAGAAGIARSDTGEPMTTEHQFTIASVGKTMTAVIILQMREEGLLGEKGLDATLEDLQVFPVAVMDALHKIDGKSYGRRISVRQLLNHTSGLKDVLMDDENGRGEDIAQEYHGYAPGSLNGVIVFDEQKGYQPLLRCLHEGIPAGCRPDQYYLTRTWAHWDYPAWVKDPKDKMAGLLNFYLGGMNESALWEPGANFHYADTNYILLGLMIEKISGQSLHRNLRERIFDPLEMDHTYLAYGTDPDTQAWEGRHSDHWGFGAALISNGINLSMDWGAGGEVSTVEDLSKFTRALASGKLFKHRSTLDEMFTLPQEIQPSFYSAGIIPWRTGGGFILHHNGAPGSWIEYHSAENVTIVGTVNDIDDQARFHALRGKIFAALADAGLESFNIRSGAQSISLLTMMNGDLPIGILVILGLCLMIFLTTLLIFLISFFRGRRFPEKESRIVLITTWLAVGMIMIDLLFLAGFVYQVIQNPVQLMFGYNASLAPLLYLPFLSMLLTIGTVIMSIVLWKDRLLNLSGRIHFSLISLAGIAFLWILGAVNLLVFY